MTRLGPFLSVLASLHMHPLAISASSECWTPVHDAAMRGDANELSELLNSDRFQADAEDLCETKIRPLHLATASGSTESVRALLDAGASADVAHGGNGATPLIAAAAAGNTEMVEMLCEANAKVNRAEARNMTAIMFAAQQGYSQVVDMLLARGADPDWVSATGLTAWMLASAAATEAPAGAKREMALATAERLSLDGAPAGEDATLWLVGMLPRKTLAKYGVTDLSSLERLMGGFSLARIVEGVSPEQLAMHGTLQRAASHGLRAGAEGADHGMAVPAHAVGSGPMALYVRQVASSDSADQPISTPTETLFLRFDAQPGKFSWTIVGATGSGGSSAKPVQGRLYLRGRLAQDADSQHNRFDPVNVAAWDVSVALAPPQGQGTRWVRASKLRLIRGAEGAARWAALQKGRAAQAKDEM